MVQVLTWHSRSVTAWPSAIGSRETWAAAAWRASSWRRTSALVSRGLEVEWADAPWLLVRRGGLRDLLARHGVIVRDCASFGWSDTFRVATPRTEQLGRVLEAIDRVVETEGER